MAAGSTKAAQGAAVAASRSERDSALVAIHELERVLGRASGGRGWLDGVAGKLDELEEAMRTEQHELNRPDALLAMVVAEHPRRFSARVRNLREQYADIIRQVESLRSEIDATDEGAVEVGDIRQRAGWIVRALHHCRARQTDIVYDALVLDLGEEV